MPATPSGQTSVCLDWVSQEGARNVESIGGGPGVLGEVPAGVASGKETIESYSKQLDATEPSQRNHARNSTDTGLDQSPLVVALLKIAAMAKVQKTLPELKEVSKGGTSRQTERPQGDVPAPTVPVKTLVDEQLVGELFTFMQEYFGGSQGPTEREAVRRVLSNAVAHCNLEHGMKEAVAWGASFEWEQASLVADMASFEESEKNLAVMVKQIRSSLRNNGPVLSIP